MNWYKITQSGLWEDIEEKTRNSDAFGIETYFNRSKFTKNYGWAIPSKEAIEGIKKFVGNNKVIEVGSGLGLWAKLLQDAGVHVTATDLSLNPLSEEGKGNRYIDTTNTFTDVEEIGNIDAIEKYRDHSALLMVWPPYDDPMADESLKAFQGDKLIFIGEGQGGCTGGEGFFCTLANEWTDRGYINIPNWDGIHDYIHLFTKN